MAISCKPPKKNRQPDTQVYDQDSESEADIVAEDIEAGYDIQSDAATKSLVDDPESSSEGEVLL